MRQIIFLLTVSIFVSTLMTGCGGGKVVKDKSPYADYALVDIHNKKLKDADAQTLYQAGHQHLLKGQWDKALRAFSEVDEKYTFTRYATQSRLEMATAEYMRKNYDVAIDMVDRFIKDHPRHPNLDYLYYLRGVAEYSQTKTGKLAFNADKRDLSNLKRAFSDFQLLLRTHPDSQYAADARQRMIDIRNRLAHREVKAAEYYLSRRAWIAAIRRGDYILTHYQRSTSTPRALEIIKTAYEKLGMDKMAHETQQMLETSYPDYLENPKKFNKRHDIKS